MHNLISLFKAVVEDESSDIETYISDTKKYFYRHFSIGPFTNRAFYYFLSTQILVKANIGIKNHQEFINQIEISVRKNKSWLLLAKSPVLDSILYSENKIKQLVSDLLMKHYEQLKKENNEYPYCFLEKFVKEIVESTFKDQEYNLAALVLFENS